MPAPLAALAVTVARQAAIRCGGRLASRAAVGFFGGFILVCGGLSAVVSAHIAPASPAPLAGGGRPLDCRPTLTQPFGPVPGVWVNGSQVEPILNGAPFHTGVDLACVQGSGVRSVTTGVAHVSISRFGYGLAVRVSGPAPGGGEMLVLYGHLSEVSVPDGAEVQAGDALGSEGSSGSSSGPHLHFELDVVDPHRGTHPVPPCVLLDGSWIDLAAACGAATGS